jgi:serine/threonine-protein kinase
MPLLQPGSPFHHLRVERFLSAGAHGEVYAARSLATGEPFALKVVQVVGDEGVKAVQRALAAARGVFGIDHPNVVKVYDVGCEPDGKVYQVMELLAGCSIHALVRWGRVSAVFALTVAIEAARGLGAAHGAMIVHRDVKPSNLFLVNAGPGKTQIKVLDFSMAKVFQEGVETTAGRRAGLGTVATSAPEQLAGAVPHPGFDIYGLGITLWELLAGQHPFQSVLHDMAALIHHQRHEMPPLLSEIADLPPRADDVVRRAIAKHPASRYASMTEMAEKLSELRSWLIEEERAGRLVLVVPLGQPAIPGDDNPYDAHHVSDVAATMVKGGSLAGALPLRDALLPPAPPSRKDEPR